MRERDWGSGWLQRDLKINCKLSERKIVENWIIDAHVGERLFLLFFSESFHNLVGCCCRCVRREGERGGKNWHGVLAIFFALLFVLYIVTSQCRVWFGSQGFLSWLLLSARSTAATICSPSSRALQAWINFRESLIIFAFLYFFFSRLRPEEKSPRRKDITKECLVVYVL